MSEAARHTQLVKAAALAEGFDLVGVAKAAALPSEPLDHWLEQGFDANLWYVRERREERLDPELVVPGVKSVISLAFAYDHTDPEPPQEPYGVVARYARGRDYHNVFKRPLRRLRALIEDLAPGSFAYSSCDTRPVMEKAWAQRAGLGWIGKNGLLIAPPYGSYVLLGCIMTTLELVPDKPHPDRCGTCRACIPACPTDALSEERYVDARKCLSYHTIEHRLPMPADIAGKMSGRLFGCDLCQDPCPWNRRPHGPASDGLGVAMAQDPTRAFVPLASLLRATKEERTRFAKATALARAASEGLERTAKALDEEARKKS